MNNDQLKKLENDLGASANSLRTYGGIKAADYAVPVLGLIFLRFADNKYSHYEKEIIEELRKHSPTFQKMQPEMCSARSTNSSWVICHERRPEL